MKSTQTRLDRRTMLKGGAALGLSTLLTSTLLTACGGGDTDDGDTPAGPAGKRETRSLNFDLSSASITEPRLQLYNSKHHNTMLKGHDDESRLRHRQQNTLLASVPDTNLTHYLDDVDLPAEALQIVGVWGKHPATGHTVLASHYVHVPKASLDRLAKTRAQRGQKKRSLSSKMRASGASAQALASAPIQSQIDFNSPPWDVACWMIFQHPSVMNVNADLGADILDRIQNLPCDPDDDTCDPYSGTLAEQISELIGVGGYPSTTDTGSWAMLDPYLDPVTNLQVIDDEGNPVYMYKMNEALSAPVATAVKQILGDIMDDPAFIGSNAHPLDDTAAATTPIVTPVALAAALASSEFQLASNFSIGKTVNGIKVESLTCADDRAVSVNVRHYYLRTLGVYVEYIGSDGATLPPDNKGGIDTDTAKFVGPVMADNQIMGVPILSDWLNPASSLQFTMPAAVKAKLHFGSLGIGGADPFSPIPRMGAISTLFLNIVLPSAFLVYGIATTFQKNVTTTIQTAWKAAIEDPKFIATIVNAIVNGGIRDGIQGASGSLSVKPFITQVTKLAVGLITQILPLLSSVSAGLLEIFGTSVAASQAAKAIPIVGEALWVLSTVADVAAIGETIVEFIMSPALKTYELTLTMDSTVRISRDPGAFQFPATATHFLLKADYGKGSTPLSFKGTVATGQIDPIDVPLKIMQIDGSTTGVISGGTVTVTVDFYSDNNCLVGHGTSGLVNNLPVGDGPLLIPFAIKEMLVPLNAATTYEHQLKLVYQNGARAWSPTAPPPALTRANLCQGNDGAICALHGLTVNTATGMAAYGFNAGGQGVSLCGGGTAASLNTISNVFLGTNPDSGLKFSSCGSAQPIGVVYASTSSVLGGNNFFLQLGSDNYYHLRGVDLDSSNFNMAQTVSWGRFHSPLDSLTVTSNGVAIGINRATHKMEALHLPQSAQDSDANFDSANTIFSVISSGKGASAGHLDTPVAVSSYGNTVLVLEQGNLRVQAFDTDGNNLKPFKDGSGNLTPLLVLKPETGVTYVDLAAEATGYVYVLSYTGAGTTPGAYRLDVYTPDGSFMSRTTGVSAGAIAVDLFRNLYTLNYEVLSGSPRVEPSLSQWIPYSTVSCAATASSSTGRSGGLLARAQARAQSVLAQCRPSLMRGTRRLA